MATAAIKRYWNKLVGGGCLICGGPAEIAHCAGTSITERTKEPKAKGKKLPRMDWLVLPLCDRHHRNGGSGVALDLDRGAWESNYGTQARWIDSLCFMWSLDLWALANQGRK